MEKPYILHMLTPGTNVSPFDVNMALDAGYHAVIPYTGVTLEEVVKELDRRALKISRRSGNAKPDGENK